MIKRLRFVERLSRVFHRARLVAHRPEQIAQFCVIGYELSPHFQVLRICRSQRLSNGKRLSVAIGCSARIAQVCLPRLALHVTNLLVRGRHLLPQRSIVLCFCVQAIQILEGAADQQLSGRSRSRQVFDGVVDFEHERVGQLAHIIKAPLRAHPLFLRQLGLLACDPRLVQNDTHACQKRNGRSGGSQNACLVPEHELGSAISKTVLSRKHGKVLQVAPNVFCKLFD